MATEPRGRLHLQSFANSILTQEAPPGGETRCGGALLCNWGGFLYYEIIIDICQLSYYTQCAYILNGCDIMARPRRCRRICAEPAYNGFVPESIGASETVVLSVDEYEVIRLIDLEKLTQEKCASQIGVARTTVTDIYETAREKLADCIVNGKRLSITGGCYFLCDGKGGCHLNASCKKNSAADELPLLPMKGENTMRIAVTYNNGEIFQHFGHAKKFAIYDESEGKIIGKTLLDTNGSGHGALAALLKKINADALICGGIGGGARAALEEAGIKLYGGVSGSCDDAVNALIAGTLEYSTEATCSHHEHEHANGHTCGEHSCGEHSCGEHSCAGHSCGGHTCH